MAVATAFVAAVNKVMAELFHKQGDGWAFLETPWIRGASKHCHNPSGLVGFLNKIENCLQSHGSVGVLKMFSFLKPYGSPGFLKMFIFFRNPTDPWGF